MQNMKTCKTWGPLLAYTSTQNQSVVLKMLYARHFPCGYSGDVYSLHIFHCNVLCFYVLNFVLGLVFTVLLLPSGVLNKRMNE